MLLWCWAGEENSNILGHQAFAEGIIKSLNRWKLWRRKQHAAAIYTIGSSIHYNNLLPSKISWDYPFQHHYVCNVCSKKLSRVYCTLCTAAYKEKVSLHPTDPSGHSQVFGKSNNKTSQSEASLICSPGFYYFCVRQFMQLSSVSP